MQDSKTKTGFHLFKLAGFQVSVDWSWLFLAILVTWTLAAGYFPLHYPHLTHSHYWSMGVLGALGLFVSIILHELCHSLVGRHFGIPISGITLFIFGGVAEIQESPPSPKAEFWMSVVGPLFSILFGIFFLVLLKVGHLFHWPLPLIGILNYLGIINIFLGIFNLFPGFPLDGGRILRSLLWWWKGNLQWATQVACQSGASLGFVMIIFGIVLFIQGAFISGFWMALLGFFLQHIAKLSYQTLLIQKILGSEKIRAYVKTNPITVSPQISLQTVVDDYFYRYYHKLYPVIDHGKLLGAISFETISQMDRSEWQKLTVRDVMTECTSDNIVEADTPVVQVLSKMTQEGRSRYMVVDHSQLYGVIALKDLLNIISIRVTLENDRR